MKADKILITVLVLSLTVAAFTLYQRSRVEEPYYRVELVADYEQYKELADDMGMLMTITGRAFRDVGVTGGDKGRDAGETRADGLISVMNLWELMGRTS